MPYLQFQDVVVQLEHLKKMLFGEKKIKDDKDKKDDGNNKESGIKEIKLYQ